MTRFIFNTAYPSSFREFIGEGISYFSFCKKLPFPVLQDTWAWAKEQINSIPRTNNLISYDTTATFYWGEVVSVLDRDKMSRCLQDYGIDVTDICTMLDKVKSLKHPDKAYVIFTKYSTKVFSLGYTNMYLIALLSLLSEGVDIYDAYNNSINVARRLNYALYESGSRRLFFDTEGRLMIS